MTSARGAAAVERLRAAIDARKQGETARALEGVKWFFENALDEDPALYGVKWSVCTEEWAKLADDYPEARRALIEIRDRTARDVLLGKRAVHRVGDLLALNRAIGDHKHTHKLIREVHDSSPDRAREFTGALPLLVELGDFDLAYWCSPDPSERLASLARNMTTLRCSEGEPVNEIVTSVIIDRYVEEVVCVIRSRVGVGAKQEARQFVEEAFRITPDLARDAVREAAEREGWPWVA